MRASALIGTVATVAIGLFVSSARAAHVMDAPPSARGAGDGGLVERALAARGLDRAGRDGPIVEEWIYATGAATLSSPRIADVDGDGVKDIVLSTYDPVDPYSAGVVYVIDINGNDLPGWPQTTVGPPPASPAIADLEGDGDMEVIVGSWSRHYVWNHDGTAYPGWPKYSGTYRSDAIADLDGDGDLEIIHTTTGTQITVWHHNGTTMAGWPYTAPESVGTPAVADIDGDGDLEIAAGTYEGPVGPDPFEVYVWEADGTVRAGFPVSTSGVVKAPVALADVDGDGLMEIVADAYHTSNLDYVYVWDHEGNAKPGWPVRADYVRLSGPSLGDLDGDGDLEVVVGGLDPAPFPERVFAFHHDGTEVSGWPVTLAHAGGSGNINSSLAVADIDGNPVNGLESIGKVRAYIFALHADGTIVDGYPYYLSDESHTGSTSPSPAVADMDNDGDVELVFVSSNGRIAFFDEPEAFSSMHAHWPMFKHDAHNTAAFVPLEEPCPWDCEDEPDGTVGIDDLVAVINHWGPCPDPGDCPWDCEDEPDGTVGIDDLVAVINHWGACP